MALDRNGLPLISGNIFLHLGKVIDLIDDQDFAAKNDNLRINSKNT